MEIKVYHSTDKDKDLQLQHTSFLLHGAESLGLTKEIITLRQTLTNH